jgi:hypothetical protein
MVRATIVLDGLGRAARNNRVSCSLSHPHPRSSESHPTNRFQLRRDAKREPHRDALVARRTRDARGERGTHRGGVEVGALRQSAAVAAAVRQTTVVRRIRLVRVPPPSLPSHL